MRYFTIYLLILLQALEPVCFANGEGGDALSSSDRMRGGAGAVYTFQNYPTEVLITVKVLGEVRSPGLYRVPQNTTLVTLLTLSGGVTSDASGEVVITNADLKSRKTYDFNDLNRNENAVNPIVRIEDTVFVPKKSRLIGENTVAVISVLSSITTIILAIFVIARR